MNETAPQGSEAWSRARLGKLTASRVSDALARTKTGWGASRKNYMAELIIERLTGVPSDSYINDAMKFGIETEPQARSAYEFHYDVEVEKVGFIDHPKMPMAGASPDGLVGKDGLVEIKCPNSATHLDTLLNGTIPDKYIVQMQFQMAVTDRQWCDFISFDPRLPERMRLWVKRIDRDPSRINMLDHEGRQFLREVDEAMAGLTKAYGPV